MNHPESKPNAITTKERIVKKTRKVFAHVMLELLAAFDISIEVDEDSKKNLTDLDTKLLTESAVMISNHTSAVDIASVLTFIELMSNLKTGCYVIAQKFAVPNLNKPISLPLFPILKIGDLLEIKAVPVPQTPEEKSKNKVDRIGNYEQMRDLLLSQPGSVLGIMPEGTRSQILNQFKPSGIGNIALRYQSMYVVPASLVRIGDSKRFQLTIGKPQRVTEIVPTIAEDAEYIKGLQAQLYNEVDPDKIVEIKLQIKTRLQIIADQFGYEIAVLLPESMRGYYGTTWR